MAPTGASRFTFTGVAMLSRQSDVGREYFFPTAHPKERLFRLRKAARWTQVRFYEHPEPDEDDQEHQHDHVMINIPWRASGEAALIVADACELALMHTPDDEALANVVAQLRERIERWQAQRASAEHQP